MLKKYFCCGKAMHNFGTKKQNQIYDSIFVLEVTSNKILLYFDK